jgi:hypothetical protein
MGHSLPMRRGGPRPEAKRKWAGKARRTELLQVGKGHSISEISVLAEDSWGTLWIAPALEGSGQDL